MAKWLMGDWLPLAALTESQVEAHPNRDRLALLVACAHQQLDRHDSARQFVRQALQWGCHPELVARLLISGVHNTMGRVAALRQDNPALERHFGQALRVTGDPQAPAAAHARAVRELTRLGLVPQAAGLIQHEVEALSVADRRPVDLESQLQALRREVEWLQASLTPAAPAAPAAPATPAAPVAPP
jgi:hypothetical protein